MHNFPGAYTQCSHETCYLLQLLLPDPIAHIIFCMHCGGFLLALSMPPLKHQKSLDHVNFIVKENILRRSKHSFASQNAFISIVDNFVESRIAVGKLKPLTMTERERQRKKDCYKFKRLVQMSMVIFIFGVTSFISLQLEIGHFWVICLKNQNNFITSSSLVM